MSERLRLIQVGAGQMGRAWLRTIAENPAVELVGLVDVDEAVARAAAGETGFPDVPVSTDLAELLGTVGADAVVNVTIPTAHASVSTAALLRGLPVLCEKPLADSTAVGLTMVAAAEASGRLLMVSQSRRYWNAVGALRPRLPELGRLGTVTCSFYKAPHFGGFRDAMDYPLLLDMAIHQFDLARALIGSEPVSIRCDSFNPAWSWYAGDASADVHAVFADGTRFAFDGCWCAPGLETSWNGAWRISGEHGTATWDGDGAPSLQTGAGAPEVLDLADGPEQIAGSLAEFVAALQSGATPNGEVHDNVMSLAMVEAAVRSAETGEAVLLADVLTEAHNAALGLPVEPQVRAVMESWGSVADVAGHPERYAARH